MSAIGDIIVAARDLKVGYAGKIILQGINFQVYPGEVFVILGRSGCGKSTLLKHLIGLYQPMAGEVWIEGENMVVAQGERRLNLLRRFGVLYQNGALFGSMTTLENVRLPLDEFTDLPAAAKDFVARTKLRLVGLAGAEQAYPAELSSGMQKRAAIARAMALEPRLLFLDEPSAGLDPITSAGLDALIKVLAGSFGITFVIVSHELPSVFAIAKRVIMLDERTRTIVAEGAPGELRDQTGNPWVRRFFNREPELDSN
jgi:phospholipid/cholesterol/gamma-HCH transport system ATP-binding protein